MEGGFEFLGAFSLVRFVDDDEAAEWDFVFHGVEYGGSLDFGQSLLDSFSFLVGGEWGGCTGTTCTYNRKEYRGGLLVQNSLGTWDTDPVEFRCQWASGT